MELRVLFLGYLITAVLCTLDSEHAKLTYNTKLTYSWSAVLNAGSLLPVEHLSQYRINAELNVYISDKYVFQLVNVSTTDSNVRLDPLYLPFGGSLNDATGTGSTFYRATERDGSDQDESWSLNMKRSLASLFQLKPNSYDEGACTVREDSTYGSCEVDYITIKSNSAVTVKKIINLNSCTNSSNRRWANTPFCACQSEFQEGFANHNERTYKLIPEKSPFIEEIYAVGTLHFQPFQALAEAHYINVSQTLRLNSIQNNTESEIVFNPSLTASDIRYSSDNHFEPTSGRIPSNKTLLKQEIYKLLENLTDCLDWELSTQDLDNQTSFYILELMWALDIQDWEDLYQMVSVGTSYSQETIQHFFSELIPQVGSEASVVFIRNLITSNKVTGFSASYLLITFPLHVKRVSEKFLLESEEFIRLRDVDTEVKHSGILSFATLVHKACAEQQCAVEVQDRYTKYFLDKFMETSSYQERMVYLQALCNMQLPRILDYLGPIITNPSYDRHIRYLAIWCTMSAVDKNRPKATEIFWPIFFNSSEALEIRVSALSVLTAIQPSSSRLLTFFWHMQNERNYQLYNFFYTSIHSFANTKYPCYQKVRHIASQLRRYLLPRAYRWGTGNYILDYEDSVRGYGGLIHLFVVASERTGLPSSAYITTEHHSHGLSSKASLFVKVEGFADVMVKTIFDVNNLTSLYQMNVTKFLLEHGYAIRTPEEVHVEVMVKIDGNTVYCKYLNQTSFIEILYAIKKASALYYDFSVNYQRLKFPLLYEASKITDLGTPVTLQIRTASMLSIRGSIQQVETGKNRNAELDLRYSLDTVTSLKAFNPFTREWYGTERSRSLHGRIPFSTHLFERVPRSVFEITANRHKDFIDGSLLGFVWHSTMKLSPVRATSTATNQRTSNGNGSDVQYWSVESRDLGARFDAKKFNCQGENDNLDSLYIIKEAFQLSNKNYKMVIGGVPILGLYSFVNYFTFLPPGDSCGIIISMAPLKFQLALLSEGNMVRLSMRTEKEQTTIWDLITHYRPRENEGLTTIDFRLQHSEAERNITLANTSWRLIQFEGYFKIPSFRQGVLKAPSPSEGHAKLTWGDKTHVTSIELDLQSENTIRNWPLNCENDTAACLQLVSNFATEQRVLLNCSNLPIWATTALLSIFPDNVQADKASTRIQFRVPAKVPWTTQGICVINEKSVLNFDNSTVLEYKQRSDCYSVVAAECSPSSLFLIGIKKTNSSDMLELKVISGYTQLVISPPKNITQPTLSINETTVLTSQNYQVYPAQSSDENFIYKYKFWQNANMVEIVIGHSGLILQYYGLSVVTFTTINLRGVLCGLCGDFNGETSNDRVLGTSCISNFRI